MRRMTIEEAKHYILAGYFPKENEVESICDLQDVFGNLSYWKIIGFAGSEDETLRENTKKLLRLIWSEEMAERVIRKGEEVITARKELGFHERKVKELKTLLEYANFEMVKW